MDASLLLPSHFN